MPARFNCLHDGHLLTIRTPDLMQFFFHPCKTPARAKDIPFRIPAEAMTKHFDCGYLKAITYNGQRFTQQIERRV